MEFAYDGGGMGKGGAVTLYLDGNLISKGRVDFTEPMVFSPDQTLDVGSESGTMAADGTNPVNLTDDPSDDQMPFWRL